MHINAAIATILSNSLDAASKEYRTRSDLLYIWGSGPFKFEFARSIQAFLRREISDMW